MAEHENNNKKILCLDFDGVIHSYIYGWEGDVRKMTGPMVPGTIEKLIEYVEEFDVQIYSSRSGNSQGIAAMWQYIYNGAYEYYSKQKLEKYPEKWAHGLMIKLSFPTQKPPAYVSLDDRVITFNGVWPSTEELKNFKPWYQRGK